MDTPARTFFSASDVAALLGRTGFSISAFASRNSVGQLIGRRRIFTATDVEYIRANLRAGAGCPLMSDPTAAAALGAKGGAATAKARKRAKKKAARKADIKKRTTTRG